MRTCYVLIKSSINNVLVSEIVGIYVDRSKAEEELEKLQNLNSSTNPIISYEKYVEIIDKIDSIDFLLPYEDVTNPIIANILKEEHIYLLDWVNAVQINTDLYYQLPTYKIKIYNLID